MNKNTQIPGDLEQYLEPAHFVDSDSSAVREFVADALKGFEEATDTDRAIVLFDAVRDGIRYDPFSFTSDEQAYVASHVLGQDRNWCVPKAVLLTACLRATGIPAAVGFADVRNHLTSPKLAALMQTDLFIYHGYVQLWLDGKSYKITPAFNTGMCERFGVKPLVFDGKSNALFHEFDQKNRRHMEYVNDRGVFQDAPIAQMLKDFHALYPNYEETLTFERTSMMQQNAPEEFSPHMPVPPKRMVPGEKKGWEDFHIGERLLFQTQPLTKDQIKAFAREWDPQSLHLDEEYATAIHGSLIASGFHSLLLIMRPMMAEMMVGCRSIGGFGFDKCRWTHPVKPDEVITVVIIITEARESSSRPGTGIIAYDIRATNPEGTTVFTASTGALLYGKEAPDPT